MSYSEMPPRSGRSPMFYLGIGCLTLVCVGMIGCIGLGLTAYNFAKDGIEEAKVAAQKPVPLESVKAGLKDIPVYPNAQYMDNEGTRVARVALRFMLTKLKTAQNVEMANFVVADAPEKTLAWYDKKMVALGYESAGTKKVKHNPRDSDAEPTTKYTHTFRKKSTAVVISYDQPEDAKAGSLMLMRFDGITENFRADNFGSGGSFRFSNSEDSADETEE